MKRILFFTICIFTRLIASTLVAQQIIWADRVVDFSSELSPKSNGVQQILGAPNAFPQGGRSFVAYQPASCFTNQFVKVGFSQATKAKYILIAENFLPGNITKVEAFNEKNDKICVFEGKADSKESYRVWKLEIPDKNFCVKEIMLTISCKGSNQIPQIDAIGLQVDDLPYQPKINELQEISFLELENLGLNINSYADELMPVISPDGKTLYFVRYKHHENIGKEKKEDIWIAHKNDSIHLFTKAVNIGRPLNNESINAVISVSPDGNTLLLMNEYKPKGKMNKGVSISHKSKNGWETPVPLVIHDFYNENDHNEFFLSASGNLLFMTVERKDGFGQRDIYMSKRNPDNTWSKPVNLGPQINTAGDEASPFLAADEKTLYFASDGYPGYGEHDLYYSKRMDDSWLFWTTPVNLGKLINTNSFDAYFTIDATGSKAYFVRENNENKSDIYCISLPKEAKPEPVVLVKGKVLDMNTQKPLKADVEYQILPTGEFAGVAKTDPFTGEYQIILPIGKVYSFHAKSLGYISESEVLDLTQVIEFNELKKEINTAPLEVGQHVQLKNIFFEFGKSELLPSSFPELDRVVKLLKENPTIEIEVAGHTDDIGSHEDNMKLSEERAKSVELYFEKHGIDKKRLSFKGYGETQPLVPNDSPENRAINRRVEFIILKK